MYLGLYHVAFFATCVLVPLTLLQRQTWSAPSLLTSSLHKSLALCGVIIIHIFLANREMTMTISQAQRKCYFMLKYVIHINVYHFTFQQMIFSFVLYIFIDNQISSSLCNWTLSSFNTRSASISWDKTEDLISWCIAGQLLIYTNYSLCSCYYPKGLPMNIITGISIISSTTPGYGQYSYLHFIADAGMVCFLTQVGGYQSHSTNVDRLNSEHELRVNN